MQYRQRQLNVLFSQHLQSVLLICCLGLLFTGCPEDPASTNCSTHPESCGSLEGAEPARLYVDPPFGLGFGCVLLGCNETKMLALENRGGGSLAIISITLKEGSSEDFSFALFNDKDDNAEDALAQPSIEEPLIVKMGKAKTLAINYLPQDGIADNAVLIIEAHDASLDYAQSVVTKIEVPVRSRVLGGAAMAYSEESINFGYVETGSVTQATLTLTNTSENDAVLTLASLLIENEHDVFSTTFPEQSHVNPGDTIDITLNFSPSDFQDYSGQLLLATNDTAQPLVSIPLMGTAFSEPGIRITPSIGQGLNFGEIRQGEVETLELQIFNAGGASLIVTPSLSLLGDTEAGTFSMDAIQNIAMPGLLPLTGMTFAIHAAPTSGGLHEAVLQLATNDPNNPTLTVTLSVYGNAPVTAFNNESIDFGDVVVGWQSAPVTIEISNNGTGDLTIYSYSFEIGSSPQIQMVTAPELPVKIGPDDDPVSFSFYLSGQTLGPANAAFLLQTDGINFTTARLEMTGQVVSCIEGCPVANGMPNCDTGACEIGSCIDGYHDTNTAFLDGCECQEERNGDDIGANCSYCRGCGQGNTINLGDDCSNHSNSITFTGNLHSESDADLYFVKMDDAGSVICDTFGDSFRAKVELLSAPPGLALCANIQASGTGCGGYSTSEGETVFDSAYCGANSYSVDGSYGSGDSKDVVAWVVWRPDASPICTNYQIKFRADD
jgi:hypothetical protein